MKRPKLFQVVLLVLLCLLPQACRSEDPLAGTWVSQRPARLLHVDTLVFEKGGTVRADGLAMQYEYIDERHIKIGDKAESIILSIEISGDLLTLRDQFENPQQFLRAK